MWLILGLLKHAVTKVKTKQGFPKNVRGEEDPSICACSENLFTRTIDSLLAKKQVLASLATQIC